MKYDFVSLPERRKQASRKWQIMLESGDIPEGIVPFSVADMEFKMPPEIVDGLKNFLDTVILGYSYADEAYCCALQDWMKRRHQFLVEKDWMTHTTGVVPAFFAGVSALTKSGEGVLIMPPVYPPFFMSAHLQHRTLHECPLVCSEGYYEIDFDRLETILKTKMVKVLLFCSPHNPVGRVWKKWEIEKVAELCLRYSVFLLVDEIHHDLVLQGHTHTVLQGLSHEVAQNSITHVSLSKTFNLAGMMLSTSFIANTEVRQKFNAILDASSAHVYTPLGFKAYEIAYNHCETWLDELLTVIDANQKLVCSMLESTPIQVHQIEGTYLLWLDCRALGLNDTELKAFLQKKALLFLSEGHTFGKEGQGFARLNLAAPRHVIESAILRLKSALMSL
ncbi:MAG: pyridoxal phosphate-dependent aminotransferase [Spirochaetaceae bacterium]|nr:pyridoxal phosphate-dependent aminotransferase [Spirochaetaceae bacterium]